MTITNHKCELQTAVVTEISWNPSDDPAHRYVAEIQFISADDWDRELECLFHDAVASSGEVSSEGQLEESVAGVAWAKIKAVYPKFNRQNLGQLNAKFLADDPEVKAHLGTTKAVRKSTANDLYDGIRIYVDSKKTRNHGPIDGEGDHKARKMELWPLIKVVRIYAKADVLSSGAVLVDLVSLYSHFLTPYYFMIATCYIYNWLRNPISNLLTGAY